MTDCGRKNLRLIFPQWQGGNNESYYFGSQLLAWLAPTEKGVTAEVDVASPAGVVLENENGIVGRSQVVSQLKRARNVISEHNPDTLVTLGGDCLVSLAPFSYLVEKYGEKLGVLWVDSHPDVMTPDHFSHSHAHVLGALLGNGDADLTRDISHPLAPEKVMIAGIHDALEHEAAFIAERGIATCGPDEVRQGGQAVMDWIKRENIQYLAIHLDLDVLDPAMFRSVLFARPGRGQHDFGDAAEGRVAIADVIQLISNASAAAETVGLTVAEHLPWDAINLKKMLGSLPLLR
ncbi:MULTISPECIES: arginase family protein [unclassified Enterobacter]|jgi:arginase|uniref:arginase family protein n=1 Tax=unclassified Enterobacter TaxID=2608935 RepID=UPI0015C773ED|nr:MULTISPECIES: arginase family protein [unclassified Enterobacter]MBB3306956.1 arginase [Enterobacter sp. Sphag1F]NYI15720.1 arginase [Enterobacter sp. Sphag71]